MFLQNFAPAVGGGAAPNAEVVAQTRKKTWDMVELLASYGLILAATWTTNPLQQWLCWAGLMWIGGSAAVWLIRTRSIQFQISRIWRSLWIVGAALILSVPVVLIAANLHTLQQPDGPMEGAGAFVGYAIWAIAQQWLLQAYFLPRLAHLMPREGLAAAVVAGLFAMVHLPNMILAVVALFWGLAACFLFLRFRSVLTLGLAHAILGITLAVSIPGPVLHNMRVGLAYLQYQPPLKYRVSNAVWTANPSEAKKPQPVQNLELAKPVRSDDSAQPNYLVSQ
ncbi:MAG: CPBP family intramembrane glutamic endopeptidase [Terracidiphilus sp.]